MVTMTTEEQPPAPRVLACDMESSCPDPVSHIDEKGFLYCKRHGKLRGLSMYCRGLRRWELRELEAGRAISYQPITLTEHQRRKAGALTLPPPTQEGPQPA